MSTLEAMTYAQSCARLHGLRDLLARQDELLQRKLELFRELRASLLHIVVTHLIEELGGPEFRWYQQRPDYWPRRSTNPGAVNPALAFIEIDYSPGKYPAKIEARTDLRLYCNGEPLPESVSEVRAFFTRIGRTR